MAAAAAAAKDAALASTFAKAVEDAFTNFGSNTTGVLPVGEVTASLRQLQLRVDMPQVDELLPPVGAEPLTRAKFESLVDAVLNLQQIVDERRAATQATLRTPPVRDVLSANEGLVGDLFLSHAVMRSHGDRVISHESLLDLLRGLGLVPTRVSEESVRRILRDSGLQAIGYADFAEVLMHVADVAAVRSTDRNVPPEHRLSELLRAIESCFNSNATGGGGRTPVPPTPPAFLASYGGGGGGSSSGGGGGERPLQSQQSRYRPSHLAAGAAEVAAAAEITAARAVRLDAPRELQLETEVLALKRQVSTLEGRLREAVELLRRHGHHHPHTAGSPRRSGSGGASAPSSSESPDEHAATLQSFERVKTQVASLAAHHSALTAQSELSKATSAASGASASTQLHRERMYEQRERRLLHELDGLKSRNAKLEKLLTSARVEVKEVKARPARQEALSFASHLLASDGKASPHVSFAAIGGVGGGGVRGGGVGGGGGGDSAPAGAAPAPQVLALQGQLAHAEERLSRALHENAALRTRVDALEMARAEPAGMGLASASSAVDAAAVDVLQYASAIRPRLPGSAPPTATTSAAAAAKAAAAVAAPAATSASSSVAAPLVVAAMAPAATAAPAAPVPPAAATGRAATLAATHMQWVHDVMDASSQRDADGFGAHQLVGPPRTYPMHGNVAGAWQPEVMAGGGGAAAAAAVELAYRQPMYVSGIEIYETHRPGSVVSVALWSGPTDGSGSGGWDVVWRGEPHRALPPEARLFAPPLAPRSYATRYVRLELAPTAAAASGGGGGGGGSGGSGGGGGGGGAAQIDAVRLVGMRAPADAAAAEAPPRKMGGLAAPSSSVGGSPRQQPPTLFGAEPGSHAANVVNGPRFRQVEAELQSVKEGHAREMRQLQHYVHQLRTYGEQLRIELDRTKAELVRGTRAGETP